MLARTTVATGNPMLGFAAATLGLVLGLLAGVELVFFLLILGVALGFMNYLVVAEVPARAVAWTTGAVHSKFVFLLLLNVFLLIVGCLMDIFSAIVVVVPPPVKVASRLMSVASTCTITSASGSAAVRARTRFVSEYTIRRVSGMSSTPGVHCGSRSWSSPAIHS